MLKCLCNCKLTYVETLLLSFLQKDEVNYTSSIIQKGNLQGRRSRNLGNSKTVKLFYDGGLYHIETDRDIRHEKFNLKSTFEIYS